MTGHITDGVGFILNLKEHGVEGQKMVIIGTVFIEDLDNKEKLAEVVSESNTDLMRHATNASIATLKENPQIDYMDLCIAVEDAIKDFIKSYMRVIGSSGRYSFEKHNGPELD